MFHILDFLKNFGIFAIHNEMLGDGTQALV